ncbi:hypothetical protein [Leeuwenhoekiella sp. MAR_2009_132]|uniref:hypothetical protein n=1 Tax=Leeuwenhoekiella sp. MAR_2009_132 TaxID=1392489 RepID=UPI000B307213|nr:hypothetical protein [Leeuwenhoekiella sp. MAR_2009_132]
MILVHQHYVIQQQVTIEVIADTRNFNSRLMNDAFFGYLGAEITGNVLTNDKRSRRDLPLAVTGNSNAANGTVTLAATKLKLCT